MQTLAEAASHLRMAESLKRDAFLPSLLLAHAALEQERPMTAVAHLTKAFERDPSFIEKRLPIASYFGDVDERGRSDYLESQMLRFMQIAELNPESPTAQVLSAYCAWRLGDNVRAREAAQRAQELARQDPDTQQWVARLAASIAEVQ
jgi:Tfp pilus assembly protein PilF